MKRIAILTFLHAYNYGAELQCFALQYKLRLLKYKVEVIDLYRPLNKEFVKSNNYKQIFSFKDRRTLRKKINIFIMHSLGCLFRLIYRRRSKNRKRLFYEFHEKYTNLTKQKFYNFDSLYVANWSLYSHFVVGSDQVWNFENPFSPEPYFLTFAPKTAKKISYAASLGHKILPNIVAEKYKQWFADFDSISLREQEGAELVSRLLKKDVECVLDPTLLLSRQEWYDKFGLVDKNVEKYVLVYVLVHSDYSVNLAKYIASKLNLKVKLIATSIWSSYASKKGVEILYNIGPKEFVELFANAFFVVTNSFHGTAFSVNFNKPFYSTPRSKNLVNSMFTSLLNKVGLSDRLLYDGSEFPSKIITDIDFESVNMHLEKERQHSLAYLFSALG